MPVSIATMPCSGLVRDVRRARRRPRPIAPVIHSRSETSRSVAACEVLAAAVAIAVRAVLAGGIVGPGPLARAVLGAVQILPPEQELDRVVARGDVRLDPVGLVQRVRQKLGRDLGGVDLLAGELEARVGDHVERPLAGSRPSRRRRSRRRSRSAPRRAARRSPCPPSRRRSGCRSGRPRSAGRARAPRARLPSPRRACRRRARRSASSTADCRAFALVRLSS